MKKQVEGRTSKQAPANRYTYGMQVKYTKFEKNARPTTTEDITRALKWYENGNTVSAIIIYDGFLMNRNSENMTPSCKEKVYRTWNKKTQPIEDRELKYLENLTKGEDYKVIKKSGKVTTYEPMTTYSKCFINMNTF